MKYGAFIEKDMDNLNMLYILEFNEKEIYLEANNIYRIYWSAIDNDWQYYGNDIGDLYDEFYCKGEYIFDTLVEAQKRLIEGLFDD